MKVYVVVTGSYEEREVGGVYASADAAKTAHPVRDEPKVMHGYVAGWKRTKFGWDNGCDWNDAAEIIEYEVHE